MGQTASRRLNLATLRAAFDRTEGEEVRRGRKIRRWFAWFAGALVVTVLCLGAVVWVGALAVFDYVMTVF
jgi:hypothetical protein